MTPLLIIDASCVAYASFYTEGLAGMVGPEDTQVGVLFGFLRSLRRLGMEVGTNDVVICFDGKTADLFRRQEYPPYKATRTLDPVVDKEAVEQKAILYRQLDILRTDILPRLGFNNVLRHPNLEGDDLLAQVALETKGRNVVMVSNDNDMLQCLSSTCWIWHMWQKAFLTPKWLHQRHRVWPSNWAMVKALVGCPCDNVGGIKGIGVTLAAKHINNELKWVSKAASLIRDARAQTERNLGLVTLPHARIGEHAYRYRRNTFSKRGFMEVVEEYGLNSFMGEISDWQAFFKGDIPPNHMFQTGFLESRWK